ncbi:MAG: hypothetical protein COB77_01605 [Gammaproteobacteria bacterium]|nr:MAG: hypothetical protein COB77_01605 [Gammaproteobacteria bacterium]
MVINSIQYGLKQSIVALLAHLTAPVELLAENKCLSLTAASPRIATALNRSRSRWQRLDALIAIPWKASPAWN